jgi:hypothetical protein
MCDSAEASTSTHDEHYSRTAFPGQKLLRSLVVTGSIFPNAAVGVSEKDLEQAYVQHLDGNAPLIHILKDETRVRRPML